MFVEGKSYIIIGIQKCGTSSLEEYMRNNGYDVIRNEVLYNAGENRSYVPEDGLETYELLYSENRKLPNPFGWSPEGGLPNLQDGDTDQLDGGSMKERRMEFAPHRIPVLILRDPIRRIYSHYHYKQNHQERDVWKVKESNLTDALDNHPEILSASNYDRYLHKWKRFKPLVVYIEDIGKLRGMPYKNRCDCPNRTMTKEDEEIIISKIGNQFSYTRRHQGWELLKHKIKNIF